MERIAPLAKILAEANGIEWEHLNGTGEGGQIVEQDILDYLTKVMSGDAEPPSTPVDTPPPDWDGEDIPGGGQFDASALSEAGVESDIAEYVEQARPATPEVTATPATNLQEDDFELDEEPEMAPEPEPVQVPPAAAAAATAGAAAAGAAGGGGLGNLLSRLYQNKEEEGGAPAPAGQSEPAAHPSAVAPVASMSPEPHSAPPPPITPQTSVSATPTTPMSRPQASQPKSTAPADHAEGAVWTGTYLRRDASVDQLSDLCGQLNEALGQEVPLGLLVARAAQHHSTMLGLQTVGLRHQQGHVMPVQGGGLRDALSALNGQVNNQPDLLVTDAGAMDMDDLHYPETLSLSIGRNHEGRASLSLNGNVDTDQAAQFLAKVTETLEKPVILLV